MKPVKIEDDIPIPGQGQGQASDKPENIDIAGLKRENEILRLELENAKLRAQLAESKAAPASADETSVYLGRPMPNPEDIPPGLPPMPEIDPAAGDKTPALVEWFRDHWPEEFAVRYKGRRTHLNPRPHVQHDEDDKQEANAPTFQPSADRNLDTSPRAY